MLEDLRKGIPVSTVIETPDLIMNLQDMTILHAKHRKIKFKLVLSKTNQRLRGSRSRKYDGSMFDIKALKEKKFQYEIYSFAFKWWI